MDKRYQILGDKFSTNLKRRIGNDNLPILFRRGTRIELAQAFCDLGYTTGVEIGTMKGDYAKVLCESNPNLHLYCIDPWLGYGFRSQEQQNRLYAKAVKVLKPFDVAIIKKTSADAVGDFPDESLDFVYIDGNHRFDYVMLDLLYWQHKVKRDGIIALHDYMPSQWAGVVEAVDAFTRSHNVYPWFVTREHLSTAFWFKCDDKFLERGVYKYTADKN